MHLVVRERHDLAEAQGPRELGHDPADIVILSYADSDLATLARAWRTMPDPRPSLRLVNLAEIEHPLSIDLYVSQVIAAARCVILRLVGGLDRWRYGVEEVSAICRTTGAVLAVLPGDGSGDAAMTRCGTIEPQIALRLDVLMREGGLANAAHVLSIAAACAAGAACPDVAPQCLPPFGRHVFGTPAGTAAAQAVIVFYRAHLVAGDVEALEALAAALADRGIAATGLFVASLRDPDGSAFVEGAIRNLAPDIILNATGFSARRQAEESSPLDAGDVPVLQLVLSGTERDRWQASDRGLTPSDLAMQMALPELDGRLATTAISFKTRLEHDPDLQFAAVVNRADPAQVALAADRAAGWVRLRRTRPADRRIAIVLADYPAHGGQEGHAIGLDSFASLDGIVARLADAGYNVGSERHPGQALHGDRALRTLMGRADYERLLDAHAGTLVPELQRAWGTPGERLEARVQRHGHLVVAIQPDRGSRLDRRTDYHDRSHPPSHAYVAFHLWLRHVVGLHAIIQLGAHGTVEWLPGKAAAHSPVCWPSVLLGGLPVLYPFIVNNPGEAAPAKRRLGAVTIGHMTPPLRPTGRSAAILSLEHLFDDYAHADALDHRRLGMLRQQILEEAGALGLLAECGAGPSDDGDALTRLDTYLCDVKTLQIRDGLHVFGTAPGEHEALLKALDGGFVEPGPSGAPSRGRADVLPTGRNLYTIDPRAVPARSAFALAAKAADDLLRRHRQDQGDDLRQAIIDLWGGPTLRTGGEDLGLAMHLLGVRPQWDPASNRVTGIEIVPLMKLDRPRVDVTLRISGLFRDVFEAQIALFDLAGRHVAALDEPDDFNPLAALARGLEGASLRRATARIFGAAPGDYGTRLEDRLAAGAWQDRAALGSDYLAGSAYAYGIDREGEGDAAGFRDRIAAAQAIVHQQDHAEIDLLDSLDFAVHEGGLAVAAETLGARPALYHMDTSDPERPRTRTVEEEIRRIVRGRAANATWIAGMRRHGFRGAAEIARSVESLFAFAATLRDRFDGQFELLYDATLGDAEVSAFMAYHNPVAADAMRRRFAEAIRRGLWQPRRNSTRSSLIEDHASGNASGGFDPLV